MVAFTLHYCHHHISGTCHHLVSGSSLKKTVTVTDLDEIMEPRLQNRMSSVSYTWSIAVQHINGRSVDAV